MAGDTPITIVGNLVDDPVLRATTSGVAVANFRIASTPRSFDRALGVWKDGQTLFLTCNAWRGQAHNVAATCRKGTRVMVHGRLRQRSYTTAEGEKRTVWEVEADEVGASLRNASGTLVRNQPGGADAASGVASSEGSSEANPWRDRISRRGEQQPSPAPPTEPSKAPAKPPSNVWAPPSFGETDPWGGYPPLEHGDDPPF